MSTPTSDVEEDLRTLFAEVRANVRFTPDLDRAIGEAARTRPHARRRSLQVAAAIIAAAGLAAGVAWRVGGDRRPTAAQPGPIATSSRVVPATGATTTSAAEPTFASGSELVVGLAPATRSLPPNLDRAMPPRILSSGKDLRRFGVCLELPSGVHTLQLLEDQWQDPDGVLAGHLNVLRMSDAAAAGRVRTSIEAGRCVGELPGPRPVGDGVLAAHATVAGTESSFVAATVGEVVVVLQFAGRVEQPTELVRGIVERLRGQAPLTASADVRVSSERATTTSGIPVDIADDLPVLPSRVAVGTGVTEAVFRGLHTCDRTDGPDASGLDLRPVDGLSAGLTEKKGADPMADATIQRLPSGTGERAWQALLSDTGFCRWSGAVDVRPWPGHPEGRLVVGPHGIGAITRVGDLFVSVSRMDESTVTLDDLATMTDTLAERVRSRIAGEK